MGDLPELIQIFIKEVNKSYILSTIKNLNNKINYSVDHKYL